MKLPPIEDPFWDEVAEGELSAEDRAVLEALADEEDAERLAAFEPLGEGFAAKVTAGLVADVRRTRRRRWIAGGATVLAAAAAFVLFVRTPSAPSYVASLTSGAATQRGSHDEGVPRFEADTRLELRLAPSARHAQSVVFSTFAVVNGVLETWDAPIERSEGGAARVVGPAGRLLAEGTTELVVFVGDEAISLDEARVRLRDGDPRLHRVALRYAP
ncbi:MAG: hypothetical protein H6721_03860 [Sandaracinus sp.]|nr:hypothetical protein [Sandaracinus sp.]MCB9631265.1 hypothetical protein [Sandaracinus sp.]